MDTDAYNERAEWLGRSSIGVGEGVDEGVDEGPYYAVGFELVADARTDVNPCRLDGVAINWTRFTDDVLARRTLCGLTCTTAIEIAESKWVLVSKAGCRWLEVFDGASKCHQWR